MTAQRGHKKAGGRRKGTPNKVTGELQQAFRRHKSKLVKALMALTESSDERVRVAAIQAAIDRGWGKPRQTVGGDPEAPLHVRVTIVDPTRPKK